ncbi:MAG: peptidylprolyl isomerase [Pseudomonadota bacterium]
MQVKLATSQGDIVLALDTQAAPETCANFAQYVRDGFYDGTIFHRVISNFMIQGGGFTAEMEQKSTRDTIQNEAKNGLKNKLGSIAMARTNAPHSASSQFFINVQNNGFLDYPGQDGWGYCVFGQVTEGLDVVQAIAQVATTRRAGHADVPTDAVTIQQATLMEDDA